MIFINTHFILIFSPLVYVYLFGFEGFVHCLCAHRLFSSFEMSLRYVRQSVLIVRG